MYAHISISWDADVSVTTTMVIIFWECLKFYQIFLLPQLKRSLIISNKLVYTSCLKSCQTTEDLGSWEIRKDQNNLKTSWNYNLVPSLQRNFVNTSKRLLKNGNGTFAVVRYFTEKVEFFSNILSVVVSRKSVLLLTCSRLLQIWFVWQFL